MAGLRLAAGPDRRALMLAAMPAVFVAVWSTGFVVARLAMPHGPPLQFLAWRYALSVAAFTLWAWLAGVAWPRDRAQWAHLAVSGVLMHAGYLGGVWAAVRQGLPAGVAALVVGLQPLLTALWAARVAQAGGPGAAAQGAPVGRRQWAGLGLGLAGLVLVLWPKMRLGEVTPPTLGLAIFALLCITAGTLYQKRWVAPVDVRAGNGVQLLAALAVTLPLALVEPGRLDWHPDLLIALAWSVLALSLGASSLLMLLIQAGAATRVSSLMYLVPPCTALLAWLLFGERLGPAAWLGMALCAWGVAWVLGTPRRVPGPR